MRQLIFALLVLPFALFAGTPDQYRQSGIPAANGAVNINPTTNAGNADVIFGSSVNTKKALVVQAKAGQTANLVEIQDNTGSFLSAINASGNFVTNRVESFNSPLIIHGYDAGSFANLAVYVIGGTGAASADGGTAALIGGDNGAGATGNGGSVVVRGAPSSATNGAGGSVNIEGGNGSGTSVGGNIDITSGDSGFGATGNGGPITIQAGQSVATDGAGGALFIAAGPGAGSGNGGEVVLQSGQSSSGNGGTINIAAGASTIIGLGGSVNITAGSSAGSIGGDVLLNAGAGTAQDGVISIGTADTDSITIGATGQGNTILGLWDFEDDVRQTFNPGANVAGINVGSKADPQPSTPINGDLWYDSTLNQLKARINSVTVSIGGSGPTSLTGTTQSGTPFLTVLGSTGANSATGVRNTAVGYQASNALTTGTDTVAMGYQAGLLNTANENVFIGSNAGDANTSGIAQVCIGYNAGTNATGSGNTILGHSAGDGFTTGGNNTLIGRDAGGAAGATIMSNVTAVGKDAGGANTANENTFVGSLAGSVNTSGTGQTHIGYFAGALVTGSDNTIVGHQAGDSFTTGARNTIMGKDAGGAAGATGMADTVLIGYQAGVLNTANSNTFIGSFAGATNTSGTNQTFIGQAAGGGVTGGSNTIVGYQAGNITLTTGTSNVLLGASTDTATSSTSNVFVAGSNNSPIDNIYFGKGMTNSTATAYTINGTGGSGTNNAGAAVQLAGGRGTGTAEPGLVVLKYPLKTTTGTTLQSLSTQSYPVSTTLFTGNLNVVILTAAGINTTETTTVGTIVGSQTLEGGMLRVGRILRIKVVGTMSSSATPPTFRFRAKLGSVAISDTGTFLPTANLTSAGFTFETDVRINTLGASASLQGNGLFTYSNTATQATNSVTLATSSTVDSTANQTVDFTVQYSTNTSGNSVSTNNITVEVLN